MRKHLIRICQTAVVIAVLSAFLLSAHAATWFSCNGDTFCGGSTQVWYADLGNNIDLVSGQNSPTGSTNVWRYTHGTGSGPGEGIATVYLPNTPGGQQEMWVQWYWKYSPGFEYNGVMNKQLYFYPSNTMGMGISGGGVAGDAHVIMTTQGSNMRAHEPFYNMSSWYADTGVWHKFKARYVLNTGSQTNGIYQAWVDDIMIANYYPGGPWGGIYYQDGAGEFSSPQMIVIYGGGGQAVPKFQYLYTAGVYTGSTDPGGSVATDTVAPYTDQYSPPEGSTGQSKTSRAISLHVKDGGSVVTNVLRSSVYLGVSVNGGSFAYYSYGAGLTFSPNTANDDDFTITRTMGSDWNDGDVASVKIGGQDVAGNWMQEKSYTFTIAPAAGAGTVKTKAQVLAYLQALPNQAGKKVLSGQMIGWCKWEDPVMWETIHTNSGRYPAIMSSDYAQFANDGYDCFGSDDLITHTNPFLKAHWSAGGLVELSWGSNNPNTNTYEQSTVNLVNLITPGQAINTTWNAMLDNVYLALKDLQDDNVIVLWRPFAEMNGWPANGSWYNGEDGTQYKNLWIYTYNYLTSTKGLTNLIWVFSTHGDGNGGANKANTPSTWYPGDAYVDIVGSDNYTDDGRFSDPAWYSHFSTYGKPYAFAETSLCLYDITSDCTGRDAANLINDIKSHAPNTIYWNSWNDWWGMHHWSNLATLMNDPWVVNRDDNPSGGVAAPASITITTTTLPNGRVSDSYSQQLTLVATGGMSPYMWDNTSGTMPPGLSLSEEGVIAGTPTAAGIYTFTVEVVDQNAESDTQDLSITIAPILPAGQYTVSAAISSFTYINSGSAGTNYYGSAETYQWPSATTANRTLLQDNTAKGLPDNIVITSAVLRGRVSSWEGSGGTVPMRVASYNVTGTIPNLHTVTWTSWAGTLSSPLATTDVPLSTGWVEWNILSSAQAAKSGNATMTLALDGGPDGASDTNRIFDQFEIVITYTQMTGPPPGGIRISVPGSLRVSKLKGTMK